MEKISTFRTKEERVTAVKPILQKLTELKIKAYEHPEIRELLSQIQIFIHQGARIELNIPFPIADVDIKGLLTPEKNERVWVKFTKN